MDVRAEVAVLVPVSMATRMCCQCSDASREHYAAAVLTWATRANATLTALSIRQHLFIATKWRPGGTQAARSVGRGGQVPRTGWVLTKDGMAPLDGFGFGLCYVILSLISVHTDIVTPGYSVITKNYTNPGFFEVSKHLNICAWKRTQKQWSQSTQTWWGHEGSSNIC